MMREHTMAAVITIPLSWRGSWFVNHVNAVRNRHIYRDFLCRSVSNCSFSNEDDGRDMKNYPVENIRNFCINHGKSTLADRLLEYAGALPRNNRACQVLDMLQVERMRGITVKAQAVSLFFKQRDIEYLFNLIDTPGHADFSYEVSRSLAACQGALLLIDATQGIQAQTMANYWMALGLGISAEHIVPVLNKVDLPDADPVAVQRQLKTLGLPNPSISISAKYGTNIEFELLPKIISILPAPKGDQIGPVRILLFDSWYDKYRGVICVVRVVDGPIIKVKDRVRCFASKKDYVIESLGIRSTPFSYVEKECLYNGQVGWMVLNMRTPGEALIGDTLCLYDDAPLIRPLPGFRKPKPMVFASAFPSQSSEYASLRDSLEKLCLTDASVTQMCAHSSLLGRGWRFGFLGSLHMEVFKERLEQEHQETVIFTAPTVSYLLVDKATGAEKLLLTAEDFPMSSRRARAIIKEPWIRVSLSAPADFIGALITLCTKRRGQQLSIHYASDAQRATLQYFMPLAEVIYDFYDELKKKSSGHASLEYGDDQEHWVETEDLEAVHIFLNDKKVQDLSFVSHKSKVQFMGKGLVTRLKDLIDKQQFQIIIQAKTGGDEHCRGGRVIARETVPAMRKDVTAKCYGGDRTRKMKLLEQQKEGKKKLKMIGQVELKHEAFLALMTMSPES